MSNAPVPMDDTTRESKVGTMATNNPRACYAVQTLVAEVQHLFPETAHEFSEYNGRNTALAVTFDFTSLAEADRAGAIDLLGLLDPRHTRPDQTQRIEYVIAEDEHVLVAMRPNAVTQDSRDPFGLNDAWATLSEDENDEPLVEAQFTTVDEGYPAWDGGSL